MPKLNGEQITALEAGLRTRRAAVVAAVHNYLHQSNDPDERCLAQTLTQGDEGAMAAMFDQLDIAHIDHELAELRAIDAALARIRSGAYGHCNGCGKAIPAARMLAQPTAAACLSCQQGAERRRA